MADSQDRPDRSTSKASGSSQGRAEDSGLIDLDAILRQGGEPPEKPEARPATPSVPVPVAAKTQRSVGVETPLPAARYDALDSLDGVASNPAKAQAADPPVVVEANERALEEKASSVDVARAVASARPAKGGKRVALTALLLAGVAGVAGFAVFTSSTSKVHVDEAPRTVQSTPVDAPKPAEPPPERDGVSLNELPQVSEGTADPAHASPKSAARATTTTPAKTAAKPEAKATLTEKELAAAGGEPGDLAGAMKDAVGGGKEAATKEAQAERNPNARQVRPPPGQVVGAINAVLPSARACLGPDDPVRTGSIVFSNDGAVSRIDLSGAKPNDACVKTALAKARVQPFSDDTFTTRITVRP